MGQVLTTIANKRRFYQDLVQLFMTQLKSSLSGTVLMASTSGGGEHTIQAPSIILFFIVVVVFTLITQ